MSPQYGTCFWRLEFWDGSQIFGKVLQPWCRHSFLTSTLDSGEWSTSHLGRFTPGKEPPYPVNRRLGGSWSLSGCYGEETKLSPPPVFHLTHFCAFAARVLSVFRIPTRPVLYMIRNYKFKGNDWLRLELMAWHFRRMLSVNYRTFVCNPDSTYECIPTYVRCGLCI